MYIYALSPTVTVEIVDTAVVLVVAAVVVATVVFVTVLVVVLPIFVPEDGVVVAILFT
jgi:hypothetical protein